MIAGFLLLVLGLSVLLAFSTFIQILYMESLRLRTRELPSLEFFRETLEDKIGIQGDAGVLAFSLIKHTTLVLLGIAFLGIALARRPLWTAALESCIVAWLTMILAGYLAPQFLYRKTSARWMLPLAPLARLLALAVRPVTGLLAFLLSLTELGEADSAKEEPASAAENIEALISAGAEEGLIEEEDKKLIQSVVEFGDKTLREVMTPRPNIVAIPMDRSLEDLRQLVIHEQYSRIPVYEGSIDQIAGFIHVRDLFELDDEERAQKTLRDLLRPIRFVPESKRVSDMLREMQEAGAHMAIVVDEYGNTAGLATLEDLVEEVFGEIRDEHEPATDVVPDKDGYIVSGSFDVDGLAELVDFRPAEHTESTTIGGLMTEWMGRVPQPGELVERDGIRIEALAASELRVEKVRVAKSIVSSQ